MVGLAPVERDAILCHAFFENYFFKLIERFNTNKLEEDDKMVCRSVETGAYPDIHPCEAMFALTFKKVPEELKTLFGTDDIEEYHWSRIHEQHYNIIPYSEIPFVNKFMGRSYPAGGNSRTLNVAIFVHPYKDYHSGASPAYRLITDMNTTYFSLETGQTDRFLGPYYDHFMGKNKYV